MGRLLQRILDGLAIAAIVAFAILLMAAAVEEAHEGGRWPYPEAGRPS